MFALGHAMIFITQQLSVLFSFQERRSWKGIFGWASG